MGKSNGRIQDWVKGGSGLRVTNGAAHVRIMGGGGGPSITYTADETTLTLSAGNVFSIKALGVGNSQLSNTAILVTKGGTGTVTQFTAGSVVFAGASGVYSQSSSFTYSALNSLLTINGANIGGAGFGDFTGVFLNGLINASDYNIISSPTDLNLYINVPSSHYIEFRVANAVQARMTSAGRWLLGTTTDDGSSRLQVSGNVAVAGQANVTGQVDSIGASAGQSFRDRGDSTQWLWYADAGVANLYFAGDRVSVDQSGNMSITGTYNGAPTVTGSKVSGAALADLLTKLATSKIIVDGTSA